MGVIIYSLIIGKPSFETKDVKTIYKGIKMNTYSFPETAIISDAAKNLIAQILVTDLLKRPSLDQNEENSNKGDPNLTGLVKNLISLEKFKYLIKKYSGKWKIVSNKLLFFFLSTKG